MKSVKLSELLQEKSVKAESLPDYESLPVLGVSNKVGITVTDHKKSKELAAYKFIEEGDFAYNPYRINVGSIGLTPQGVRGLVSPAYVVFSTKETLSPELLLNFLKSSEGLFQISKYSRGTVRKSLRFKDLCQISIALPPVEKQRLILQKREKIQDEEDALKREITLQQELIKKLRQQILQEAIEGKLTADWRAQNPDVEPASELLARIQAEKVQLVKAKKISKQKPFPPISEEEKPFALPDGWAWCRLGEIGEIQGGGTPSKSEPKFWDGNIPWICPKDMKRKYLTGSIYQISQEAIGQSPAKLIEEDSILFVVRGMILAHTFPVGINKKATTINQDMKGLTPFLTGLEEYLYLLLKGSSVEMLKCVRTSTHGTCRLESNIYFNWLIAFPPISEQKAIVAKVEKLLALCDQLEQEISQNQSRAEQLMQTVLSEAFSQRSEQTKQPSAFAERVTKPKLDRRPPSDQPIPFIFPIEQQGFSTEAPSFSYSSL